MNVQQVQTSHALVSLLRWYEHRNASSQLAAQGMLVVNFQQICFSRRGRRRSPASKSQSNSSSGRFFLNAMSPTNPPKNARSLVGGSIKNEFPIILNCKMTNHSLFFAIEFAGRSELRNPRQVADHSLRQKRTKSCHDEKLLFFLWQSSTC